ncbi:MAG TPA: YceI family protein [Pedobacter sp.]
MFLHKKALVLFSLAVMTVFIAAKNGGGPDKIKWVISKDCTVRVNGSSNVNKFSCSIPEYSGPDTLICYKNGINNTPVTLCGRLILPVIGFDCQNKMMTSDLRKTLKAKEFPNFSITFISLEKYPVLRAGQENITGIVSIELAGVSKKIEINYKISMDEQKVIHLTGNQSVLFSDFNLVPPKKLGGMIRTNNRLDVTFNMSFRVIGG